MSFRDDWRVYTPAVILAFCRDHLWHDMDWRLQRRPAQNDNPPPHHEGEAG